MMNVKLPEFYLLLLSAADAARRVDNFDLRSEELSSVKAFSLFEHEQNIAVLRILQFVKRDYDTILEELIRTMADE